MTESSGMKQRMVLTIVSATQDCNVAHRIKSIVLFSLLLLWSSVASSDTCSPGVTTAGVTFPKGDIMLKHGDPLEIFCILNEAYDGHNSSNLVFYHDSTQVPPQFVNVVNKTTLRLYVKEPPASHNMYYCKLRPTPTHPAQIREPERAVCLNTVFIGFTPQGVINFTCVSHNWDNLTCTWKNPTNHINTKYHLYYHLPGRAGGRMKYPCPENYTWEERCFWDLRTEPHYRQPYQYFYFTMTGVNYLGSLTTHHKFHHYAHVIPSPPSDLSLINQTTSSVLLTWNVTFPMQNFPPGLVHKVEYQSQWDNIDSWTTANTSGIGLHSQTNLFNLTGLKFPNTLYEVRVYMKSKDAAIENDKWSRPAILNVKTNATVPGAPPKTDIGSFEVSGGLPNRDVYIYWQHIQETLKNGDKFEYRVIQVEENGQARNLTPNETTKAYAKFKGITFNNYRFKVVSANAKGISNTVSEVFVPSRRESPPEPLSFTKIAFDEGIYELSWKLPPQSIEIEDYTVFWCDNERDRPYQCTGYLNWTHVSKNTTIMNITVNDMKIYQFAISANTKNASSGMVWASCTVLHNRFVGKMKSVWINQIGATFIEVGWKLDCSDRIGIVTGFRIHFCPIISPYNLTCREPERNTTVSGDPLTIHGNVTGLNPYNTYMVAIAVITKKGEGYTSDALYNTTLEAAPEPVMVVIVSNVTNTSMVVSWEPPINMNGILRFYKVHFNNEVVKVEEDTQVILENLTSHVNYSVSVTACTVACSDKMHIVHVQTAIGNPGIMERADVKFINSSQVLVQWKPPLIRAGYLNYYEVMVQQSDGKNNLSQHVYISNENDSQVPIPDCKEEGWHQTYTFLVRAVNLGPNNIKYYGPWSPPGEASCYSSGPSREDIIVIWVFVVLALIVLFVILLYIGKRAWESFKKMQTVEVMLPPGLAPPGDKEKGDEYGDHIWPPMDTHDHFPSGKPRSNTSADEELLLQKKEERHGRNPSGDSSGCSSGHESVSSSLTSGTQISSDSGTEVDQRPPSPDGVFDDSPAWESSSSLRQRNKSSLRADGDASRSYPYVKMGKGCSDASSLARSTPNLSDVEGLGPGGLGTWSAEYISMPSTENMGYCRVGLDAAARSVEGQALPQPQQQQQPVPLGKGYVSLASMMEPAMSPSSPARSPLPGPPIAATLQPPIQFRGYVSHQPAWTLPKEASPNRAYVMAGELVDSNKTPPNLPLVMDDENAFRGSTEGEPESEGDLNSNSYCQFSLHPTPMPSSLELAESSVPKPSVGYITLSDTASTRGLSASAVTGVYVPHRQFEKVEGLVSSRMGMEFDQDCTEEPYTKVFPPNAGEPNIKSPTTSV